MFFFSYQETAHICAQAVPTDSELGSTNILHPNVCKAWVSKVVGLEPIGKLATKKGEGRKKMRREENNTKKERA